MYTPKSNKLKQSIHLNSIYLRLTFIPFQSTQPHMCNYAFLFDVTCKSLLLKIDQQIQMQMAISRAATQIFTRLFMDPTYEYHRDQFLNITVSRNHIVRDTMQQISANDSSQLKKPLRVSKGLSYIKFYFLLYIVTQFISSQSSST